MLIGVGVLLAIAAAIAFIRSRREEPAPPPPPIVAARGQRRGQPDVPEALRLAGRRAPPETSVQAQTGDIVQGEVKLVPVRSSGPYTVQASGRLVEKEETLS